MIKEIYFISICIITIVVLYLYYQQREDHAKELQRIEQLETEFRNKQRELEILRSKTTACPIPNLDSPKKCYIDSKYECSWNMEAERCDKL